jgi:hypothetical protein
VDDLALADDIAVFVTNDFDFAVRHGTPIGYAPRRGVRRAAPTFLRPTYASVRGFRARLMAISGQDHKLPQSLTLPPQVLHFAHITLA